MKRHRLGAWGFALVACIGACGVLDRSETALVEPTGNIGDDREWALRITVLELGDETGGFVEYFRLDGLYNTQEAPYVAASGCSYFGPIPSRQNVFRIVADGVEPGSPLVLQGEWSSGRRNEATVTVEQDGGLALATPGGDSLSFVRDAEQRADRRCRRFNADSPSSSIAGPDASPVDARAETER